MTFEHNIIEIDSKDKLSKYSSLQDSLREVIKMVGDWDLKPTKIIMNQRDWEDILKFSGDIEE